MKPGKTIFSWERVCASWSKVLQTCLGLHARPSGQTYALSSLFQRIPRQPGNPAVSPWPQISLSPAPGACFACLSQPTSLQPEALVRGTVESQKVPRRGWMPSSDCYLSDKLLNPLWPHILIYNEDNNSRLWIGLWIQ